MSPTPRIASMGLAAAATVVLTGCASSLSGVGSTESFACQAPIGSQCTSISGVYANANALAGHGGNESPAPLPGRVAWTGRTQVLALPATTTSADLTPNPASGSAAISSPMALRSPPRVMRLWIAPWEDTDGDLHDASFVHVVVDTGRWLIERVRPAPRARMDVASPPSTSTLQSTAPAPEAKAPADASPTEP